MSDQPEVEFKAVSEVTTVALSGPFDDRADEVLSDAFKELDEVSPQGLVLNASRATFLGDHTVGELISHLVRLHENGVRVTLVAERGLRRNTDWWLRITKLDQVFETFENEAAAIAAYGVGLLEG